MGDGMNIDEKYYVESNSEKYSFLLKESIINNSRIYKPIKE